MKYLLDREQLINKIYDLERFTLAEISQAVGCPEYLVRDMLMELVDINTLRYDGYTFELVPSKERLSYRKMVYRLCASRAS